MLAFMVGIGGGGRRGWGLMEVSPAAQAAEPLRTCYLIRGLCRADLHHIDLLIIIVATVMVGHCYIPGRVLRIFTPCNYPRTWFDLSFLGNRGLDRSDNMLKGRQ